MPLPLYTLYLYLRPIPNPQGYGVARRISRLCGLAWLALDERIQYLGEQANLGPGVGLGDATAVGVVSAISLHISYDTCKRT